MIKHYNIILLH